MAEFNEGSMWMKLAMLLVCTAFSMHLFSMAAPGWSGFVCGYNGGFNGNSGNNGKSGGGVSCGGNIQAVQALEVIGFLAVLTALFLALCLILLDELKGNKPALICLIIFSFIAGLFIIIGIAVYEGTNGNGAGGLGGGAGAGGLASCVGIMSGICALLAGVFCILEIVGVAAKA